MSRVALARLDAYSGAMSRLLRLLLILAFVLMPVGLVPGGHAANAAPAAMADHCAGTKKDAPANPGHHSPDRAADCAIACSALPSFAGTLPAPLRVQAILASLPPAAGHGLAPEAATPPPRFS